MRKLFAVIVLIPLTALIVMFAVANRGIVTVSFDPFNAAQPAFAMQVPLFLLVFVLVGLGVVIGGIAAWLRQQKWRSRARRAESEARELRGRLVDRPQRRTAARLEGSPPLLIPPAA